MTWNEDAVKVDDQGYYVEDEDGSNVNVEYDEVEEAFVARVPKIKMTNKVRGHVAPRWERRNSAPSTFSYSKGGKRVERKARKEEKDRKARQDRKKEMRAQVESTGKVGYATTVRRISPTRQNITLQVIIHVPDSGKGGLEDLLY